VYDNSGDGPVRLATFVEGEVIGRPRWPAWTPVALTNRWPSEK
jgi:predicted ABC-type ATPase